MSRKSSSKTTSPSKPIVPDPPFYCPSDAPWGGFINIRLREEHRGQFEGWYEQNSNLVWGFFQDALASGIKVTLNYDHVNECVICSFTGKLVPPYPDRFSMSTRAATENEAIALSCWKHFVLAEQNYSDFLPGRSELSRWG